MRSRYKTTKDTLVPSFFSWSLFEHNPFTFIGSSAADHVPGSEITIIPLPLVDFVKFTFTKNESKGDRKSPWGCLFFYSLFRKIPIATYQKHASRQKMALNDLGATSVTNVAIFGQKLPDNQISNALISSRVVP